VISELEALATDVGALRSEVTGTVKVGIIGTTARWLLPALLSDLGLTHPKLKLVVTEAPTSGLEPLLASGRLDLAVLTHPVPGRDLISEPLFEEEILLVTKSDIDLTQGRQSIDISDLAGIELMLPAPGTAFRSEIDAATKPAGFRLRPAIELDGVRLLASLTFDGYGPALLPSSAVPEFLRSSVRLITIEGMARRQVGMATRSRGMPSAPSRAVMSALRSRASDPDRLPEGLRPAEKVRQTASEGAPRVVGLPNG
jgi:DNA-binding transcriptional LysR family regulator